jgi:hypothetical protein
MVNLLFVLLSAPTFSLANIMVIDLMVTSLDIYRRVDEPSALDPVANDLVAVEKRQDTQQGKSIVSGRKNLIFTSVFQSYRNTAVLCKYRRILGI